MKEEKQNAEEILNLLKNDFPDYDDVIQWLSDACKNQIIMADKINNLPKSFYNSLMSGIKCEVEYCKPGTSNKSEDYEKGYFAALKFVEILAQNVLESFKYD